MTEPDDIQLLQDYVRHDSQPAFTELVRRHIGLVYSVALRQLGNAHHAEEVTQAVFVILARKAAGFSKQTPVAGWLYETARLTTANFLRSEMRRRRREQEAYMESQLHESAEPVWERLAPLLDEAMGKLGDKERDALVLHFFEGRTYSEVAHVVNSNEVAVQKRVSRAVEKLRAFFAGRQIKVSAVVLMGAIAANSVQATPPALISTSATTAMAMAKAGAVGGPSLALAQGTLKSMASTKAKTTIVAAALALLAATATIPVYHHLTKPLEGIPKGWSVLLGNRDQWQWAEGSIHGHSVGGDSILASSKVYRDVTFSAVANTTNREASLAIRMQDADHGYLIIFAPEGTPAHGGQGFVEVIKKVPGDYISLGGYRGQIFSSLGHSAKITASAEGPWIEVFLNDVSVLRVKDSAYASGFIGLRAYGWGDYPCDATFSNLALPW